MINQLEHNDVTTKVVLDVDVFTENLQGGRKMTSICSWKLIIDLVVSTNKVPSKGETVLGESFYNTWWKRANQAVALQDSVMMFIW